MWRPAAHVIIAVCLLGLFLVRESREGPLSLVDAGFVDWLAGNSQRESRPAPLVFIEINDVTLASEPWPWTPFDYSLFFQAVLLFEPGVIACMPILNWIDEGQTHDAQYDRMLSQLIRRSPKVVLGASLGQREDPDVLELQRTPLLPHVIGDTSSLPQFSLVEEYPSEPFSLSAHIGFVNLPPAQGNVRRMPLIFLYRGQAVPSFALQAIMMWLKLTPDDVVVTVGNAIDFGGKIQVPIDESGTMLIDFSAPITRFGVDDLLLAAEQTAANLPFAIPVEAIRGNVAFLARTDKGVESIRLPDGSEAAPGSVIAATIATIQKQTFIRRVTPWFDFAFIGFTMICGTIWIRLRPTRIILFSTLLCAIYLLVCLSVFSRYLIWLPFVLPACLILFLTLYALILPLPRPAQFEG
jgi:CHASE2 domain-containing sensor protein